MRHLRSLILTIRRFLRIAGSQTPPDWRNIYE